MTNTDIGDEEFDDPEGSSLGQSGSMCNPDIHIKWICDGSETLSQVAAILRNHAEYVEALETRGWQLSEPVDNSHGFVEWKGVGEPSAGDCVMSDCFDHSKSERISQHS